MESRHDSENAERILYNMRPKELVRKLQNRLRSDFFVCCCCRSHLYSNSAIHSSGNVSFQVEVIKKAYLQGEVEFEDTKEEEDNGDDEEHDAASPRNVGHNIYILAHQVRLNDGEARDCRCVCTNNIVSPYYFLFVCLVTQLARHNKELSIMLKPGGATSDGDESLEFYANHTAQIEVRKHTTKGD